MEGQLAAPFHFAVEFLILAVCAGAAFDAVRSLRVGGGTVAAAQASGFGALVAAQVVHGALVVEGDGDLTVLVLRAVGFGLLALSLRPAVVAAAALPAVFVAGADARWAMFPAVFALAAAGRAITARRAGGPATAVLAGSFACFAAGDAVLAVASPAGGLVLAGSHAARAAGALLLARWLWLAIVRSVRLRFVAVFVASLVLLVTVVAGALTQVIGNNLRNQELDRLELGAAGQINAVDQRVNQAIQVSQTLSTGLRDEFQQRGSRLTRFAQGLFQARGLLPADADFLLFVGPEGKALASATDAQGFPPMDQVQQIAIAGSDVVVRALKGTAAGDVAPLGLTQVAVVGASPVEAAGRRIVGAVVVGYEMDRELLLGLKVGAEAEITVLKGGEVVSTTFEDPRAAAGLARGALRGSVRRVVEEQGRTLRTTATAAGERSFTVFSPLTADDRSRVVGVLVLSRPAGLLDASQRTINRTLFLITLAASAIAALLAWLLSGRVTRPIRALTRAARQVRGGDLDVRAAVELPDEVGTLGAAFNEMATSLKRMTDDLRSAADEEATLRSRMEAIMQSMGDALVATSGDGVVVTFNRAAEQMLGLRGDAAVGRLLSEVLTGVTDSGRPLAEVALASGGAHGTATIVAPDGRRIPVALSGAPLRDASGETVGRVIVLRDVSREHEAERMKSEFLSNVSHELRTPLTPIKGYTEILRRKSFPRQKTQVFLDGIMESTKRLERIVEILVDFAAMEAGRLKPSLEPVDLRTLVAGVLAPWQERDPKRRFVRRIPADLPAALVDTRLLRKCLDELIDNAIKFSPDGGDIEIEASVVTTNGTRRARPSAVRLVVRDHGIGIEPHQMASLFQDFRQLDGSETRSFGGLGLGLSYARRVALAHHGDITAESVPGEGSAFTVVLPIAPASRAAAPKPRAAAPKPSAAKSKPRAAKPKPRKPRRAAEAKAPSPIRRTRRVAPVAPGPKRVAAARKPRPRAAGRKGAGR